MCAQSRADVARTNDDRNSSVTITKTAATATKHPTKLLNERMETSVYYIERKHLYYLNCRNTCQVFQFLVVIYFFFFFPFLFVSFSLHLFSFHFQIVNYFTGQSQNNRLMLHVHGKRMANIEFILFAFIYFNHSRINNCIF